MNDSPVIDALTLNNILATQRPLILDISSAEEYAIGHLPGAIRLDPNSLNSQTPPVGNKHPNEKQLSEIFSNIGLSEETMVVAYDHQLGAHAGRLIWTLHLLGHTKCYFLNGQFKHWQSAGLEVQTEENTAVSTRYQANITKPIAVSAQEILDQLARPSFQIWDARSEEEYRGSKVVNALKGGHIPGAKHLEWTDCLKPGTALLYDRETLLRIIRSAGFDCCGEIVTHCQTHRRSGLTYIAALHAGLNNIRCYDGSWFEWGNRPDTPIEC